MYIPPYKRDFEPLKRVSDETTKKKFFKRQLPPQAPALERICEKCGNVMPYNTDECDFCGHINETKKYVEKPAF